MNRLFRTEVALENFPFSIDYQDKILMMGSCFTDSIGSKLQRLKFSLLLNPFGVLYNPSSISKILHAFLQKKQIDESSLFEYKNSWHSFDFHGSFSGEDKSSVLTNMNNSLKQGAGFLQNTNILFITFGTAWVYEISDSSEVVANCHKLPAKFFKRKRLSIQKIVADWSELLKAVKTINPAIRIAFTISPVRHLKDGLHENQLSKATLLLAVEELTTKNDNCYYFPSYELMMDDLRDYRFYKDDMTHVSDLGVNYIFEHFQNAFFTEKTKQTAKDIDDLQKAVEHRIPKSTAETKDFSAIMLKKIKMLEKEYQHINFMLEKVYFENLYSSS